MKGFCVRYCSGELLDVYTHNEAVYGLSASPNSDSIFASACDDGRILIYDTRAPPSEGEDQLTLSITYRLFRILHTNYAYYILDCCLQIPFAWLTTCRPCTLWCLIPLSHDLSPLLTPKKALACGIYENQGREFHNVMFLIKLGKMYARHKAVVWLTSALFDNC